MHGNPHHGTAVWEDDVDIIFRYLIYNYNAIKILIQL